MPELPEVETIRRDLTPYVVGRTIKSVSLHPGVNGRIWNFVWHPLPPSKQSLKPLVGCSIKALDRQGKYLLLRLDRMGQDAGTLVVHLGMTGKLLAGPFESEKHLRLHIELDSGTHVRFVDPRRFGRLGWWKPGEEVTALKQTTTLEPISPQWDSAALTEALSHHGRAPIKAVLLNQSRIAGLGNIYADEALWKARVHPQAPAGSLTPKQIQALTKTTREVLEAGIANRGTSFSDYVDGKGQKGSNQNTLAVYGRAGKACRRCKTTLVSSRVAGRGTVHCPVCQVRTGVKAGAGKTHVTKAPATTQRTKPKAKAVAKKRSSRPDKKQRKTTR